MAEGGEETDHLKDLLVGSDTGCDFPCQPCSVEGTTIESSGFCVNCDEYLCDDCYRHHKKSKLSRHHVLLDKESMPVDTSERKAIDVCTEPCKQHEGKIMECYCPQHEAFGCTVCMAILHQTCSGLQHIPDVVKDINLDQNDDFLDLEDNIQSVRMKVKKVLQSSQKYLEKSKACSSNALRDFRKMRQKLNNHLETDEVKLIEEVDSIIADDTNKQMQISKECDNVLGNIEATLEKYNRLLKSRQRCKIFMLIKNAKKEIKTLEDDLEEKEKTIAIPEYKFVPKRELLELLISDQETTTGSIQRRYCNSNATNVRALSVKCSDDSESCSIRGLTMLSEDRIVAIDRANRRVKVLDVLQNKVIPVFQFASDPWDVAKLHDDQFAVTLCSNNQGEIAIMNACSDTEWKMHSTIKVDGECRGIAYANDRLIVSFLQRGRVDLISMDGGLIKSFDKNESGGQLFPSPYYVCYNHNQHIIYVSNAGDFGSPNSVTSLSLDGEVIAIYTDPECRGPLKVVIDSYGSLHVCCWRSSNIHTLSGCLSKERVLLRKEDGLDRPYVACINEEMDETYVGMRENDKIQVYKLS